MTNFFTFENNSPKMFSLLMMRHRRVLLDQQKVEHTHQVLPMKELKELTNDDKVIELD